MRRPTKSVLRLGIVALLVYLVALVAEFPAAVALDLFSPRTPDFQIEGVRGTVWNGRAGPARIGAIAIQHVDWSLDPWPLLVGQLEIGFQMRTPGAGTGKGRLDFSSMKHFQLEHVAATFDPATLLLSSRPALAGRIRIRIHTLAVRNGTLTRLDGQLGARRILLRSPFRLQLAALSIQARPAPGQIGVIRMTAGPGGDFTGRVTVTLTRGNGYQLVARIKPEPSAPAFLEQLLAASGQPDPNGFYHLQRKGVLPPLSTLLPTRSLAQRISP